MQDFECWFSGCQKTCAHEIMLRKLEHLAHLNRPELRTRFTPRLIFSRLLFVKTNAQEIQANSVFSLYKHYSALAARPCANLISCGKIPILFYFVFKNCHLESKNIRKDDISKRQNYIFYL